MITLEITDAADSSWNKRLLVSPYGTYYQTEEYALIMKWLGRKPLFIKFFNEKGVIVGQLLGICNSRLDKKSKFISNFVKILPIKKKIFRWSYGPVIFDLNYTQEICLQIQDFLTSSKFFVKGYEHPLLTGSLDCVQSPFKKTSWGTFVIDLSIDIDALSKKMNKHSTIKNIERSRNKGVIIKKLDRSNLDLYRQVREETTPVPLHVLEKRWDVSHNIGWDYFVAVKDDLLLGGLSVSSFNGYVNEWGIARTKIDAIEKYYSQDLLKWKIIEWGIKNKFRFYDLSGINPSPINDKEKGIFNYKKKWGGNQIKYTMIKN